MKIYDAIIVGAGPSGCAAAYDLASSGKTVLLLDKSAFPRTKACAGGLSIRAVRALRYSIASIVRTVVYKIDVGTQDRRWALLESNLPLCCMTVRTEFDHYCLMQTVRAGAKFQVISTLHEIVQDGSTVKLITDREVFYGRFLIGADGANSSVRRMCKFMAPRARGFALEACLSTRMGLRGIRLDFGSITNGYGWIFPKGDHLNIGLCKYQIDSRFGRAELEQYAESVLPSSSLGHIIGQYLNCEDGELVPVCSRVLLVGDAAGLVDSLTGEGIYYAIFSGQAAAEAIAQAGGAEKLHGYIDKLRWLREDLSFCREVAHTLYSHLNFGQTVLSLPHARRALTRMYAEGASLTASMACILRPFLRV